jgi:hypothetical protein
MIVNGIKAFVDSAQIVQNIVASVCYETETVLYFDERGLLLKNNTFTILTSDCSTKIPTKSFNASLFAIFERDL